MTLHIKAKDCSNPESNGYLLVGPGILVISRVAEGHCFRLLLRFQFESITDDEGVLEASYAFHYTVGTMSFAYLGWQMSRGVGN